MCLAVPGKVISIEGCQAVVECWGVQRTVRLDALLQAVEPGAYVLCQLGFAVCQIAPQEVEATLELFELLLQHIQADDRQTAALRAAAPARAGDRDE